MGSGVGKGKKTASNNPSKPYTQNTGKKTQKTPKKEKPEEVIIVGGDSINQKKKS